MGFAEMSAWSLTVPWPLHMGQLRDFQTCGIDGQLRWSHPTHAAAPG